MFFTTYYVCLYNKLFSSILLDSCDCYKLYRGDAFYNEVVRSRKSYLGCVNLDGKIHHLCVPIMLGSYVDFAIRGRALISQDAPMWGILILRGICKVYQNFSTFDSLSMHVRSTPKCESSKRIEWYMYLNDSGLALNYTQPLMTHTYKNETVTNGDWISKLQMSNPFDVGVMVETDYRTMFDCILSYPHHMNDLKHRIIMSGPTILKRCVDFVQNKRSKNLITTSTVNNAKKLSEMFETGQIFHLLSKKSAYESTSWDKMYRQKYDVALHEGRSDKAAYIINNVVRASNAAIRNSCALSFPVDGINFFCPLNTKDLKSAGEQNILADFTIMSDSTNQRAVFDYLVQNSVCTKNQHGCDTPHFLVLDDFILYRYTKWDLNKLIELKRVFPNITTQYYWPYVLVRTRSSILIKFNHEHNVFFSPTEVCEFNIKFDERDILSIMVKNMSSIQNLIKTPPAKTTVSVNNIRGSVASIVSPLHKSLIENALGISCYIDGDVSMIRHSVQSEGHDVSFWEPMLQIIRTNISASQLVDENDDTARLKPAMVALSKMYPVNDLLGTSCYTLPIHKKYEYWQDLFGQHHFKGKDLWNLELRVAFGNPYGSCIEDGVVLDSALVPHLPKVNYNACITIDFTFNGIKYAKKHCFYTIEKMKSDPTLVDLIDDSNMETNGDATSSEVLMGCLVSPYESFIKSSKHTKIVVKKIGNHYYSLINFIPKATDMYDDIEIRCTHYKKVVTVIIKGRRQVDIAVGSKLTNAYGQKNIVSEMIPLHNVTGITRDGRKVWAQLIHSSVSIIGRLTAGQINEMLQSPELAIDPQTGIFIAPLKFVIHTLHPYTNTRIFGIKVDTLTNINGFDSQNISNVCRYLRQSPVIDTVSSLIGMHSYKLKFQNENASSELYSNRQLEHYERRFSTVHNSSEASLDTSVDDDEDETSNLTTSEAAAVANDDNNAATITAIANSNRSGYRGRSQSASSQTESRRINDKDCARRIPDLPLYEAFHPIDRGNNVHRQLEEPSGFGGYDFTAIGCGGTNANVANDEGLASIQKIYGHSKTNNKLIVDVDDEQRIECDKEIFDLLNDDDVEDEDDEEEDAEIEDDCEDMEVEDDD